MDVKDTVNLYRSDSLLLSDIAYYKYIFKKTERIVCAVFYVLEHTDKRQNDIIAPSVLESAKKALDASLKTLSCRWYTAYDELYAFLGALVALESNLRVAQATALLQETIADLLAFEIEAVLRGLRQYLNREKSGAPDFTALGIERSFPPAADGAGRPSGKPPRERALRAAAHQAVWNVADAGARPPKSRVGEGTHSPALAPAIGHSIGQLQGQWAERRRMIKDILASKGQTMIKDISEQMPDCSEKMVQREIVAMVKEGIILKEGERRWSRYSLVQGL